MAFALTIELWAGYWAWGAVVTSAPRGYLWLHSLLVAPYFLWESHSGIWEDRPEIRLWGARCWRCSVLPGDKRTPGKGPGSCGGWGLWRLDMESKNTGCWHARGGLGSQGQVPLGVGMYVMIRVTGLELPAFLILPLSSLTKEEGFTCVWVCVCTGLAKKLVQVF